MFEVAVIGAGTSGLVAARHLIQAGLRPTIFEAANTLGGAWTPPRGEQTALVLENDGRNGDVASSASSSSSRGGYGYHHPASKMWNGLTTNLSKHTCRFSDWPWPEDANVFPSVDEMHAYLESYSHNFLPTPSSEDSPDLDGAPACSFHFGCQVTSVERAESGSHDNGRDDASYKVEWMDLNERVRHSRAFQGVVVAAGFFHAPRWPAGLEDDRARGQERSKPRMLHSSEYRSHRSFRGQSVAVVGASFSALEIAADVRRSAKRVVNVLPSVPWVLPRWLPQKMALGGQDGQEPTVTILPADLVFYQRNKPFPQIPETTSFTPESCRLRHGYLQKILGHKQLHSPLGEPQNWEKPPFVAISDHYLDLVKENKIEVVHGRLMGFEGDGLLIEPSEKGAVGGSTNGSENSLDNEMTKERADILNDIDHVICCTGFTSHLHPFLSPSILSTLDYAPNDLFSPLTLAWDTIHPSLPNMAFCGMYRGPHFGTMELQARLAAGVLSGKLSLDEEEIQSALDTSKCIRNHKPRAQFPHFDYIGYMDTLSHLSFKGDYPKFNRHVGSIVAPSMYQSNDEISKQGQLELKREIIQGQKGNRMANLVLGSLLGKWSFERKIVYLQTGKLERVHGTVNFSKFSKAFDSETGNMTPGDIVPTPEASLDDNPVLYREDGIYELTPTQKFDVFREYEYIRNHDALEIYFVEGGKRANLFLSLKFVPDPPRSSAQSSKDEGENDEYWVKATSDHLCIKDLYSATFRVKMNGLSASEINMTYRVKGPNKDYESSTVLKPLWPLG